VSCVELLTINANLREQENKMVLSIPVGMKSFLVMTASTRQEMKVVCMYQS